MLQCYWPISHSQRILRQAKDGEIQKMFVLLANLRGWKEYFYKLGMEIRWMIIQLGPQTLFLTCSTAEWFSAPLTEHLRTINKNTVPNVDKMIPAELCALDPDTVSTSPLGTLVQCMMHQSSRSELYTSSFNRFQQISTCSEILPIY